MQRRRVVEVNVNRRTKLVSVWILVCVNCSVDRLRGDWQPVPARMMTKWAKDVDPAHPLSVRNPSNGRRKRA